MLNPFFMFILSFVGILVLYAFGWSNIYPPLSSDVIFFFIIAFLMAAILGYFVWKSKVITFQKVTGTKHIVGLVVFVLAGTLVEGIYHGGFPLQLMLMGRDSRYAVFGIPSVHVLLLTLTSFLATYLFHLILSTSGHESHTYIILYLLSLLPLVLAVNRGMIVMVVINCVTIFLLKIWKQIRAVHIMGVGIFLVLSLFVFGIFGNMRVNSSYQNNKAPSDSSTIMEIGGATAKFRDSYIPKSFFWTYVYASSPLANFQKNVTISKDKEGKDPTFEDVNRLVFHELLPDFIGKRIMPNSQFDQDIHISQIRPELTVATALVIPYLLLGWSGVILYILVLFGFAYLYLYILYKSNSRYCIVGLATLNTIFILSPFANMIRTTGLSFQLVYPLFFTLLDSYAEYSGKKNLQI